MMGVRKLLDLVFDNNELKILDDILPEFKRHEKLNLEEEDKEADDEENAYPEDLAKRRQSLRYTESSIEVPMANGNVMKIPISGDGSEINISEEMNKSGVWQSLEASNSGVKLSSKVSE
jgi:cell division septal protein FtsQ